MAKVMSIKNNTPSTWEEFLQAFLFWKQAPGLSERTLLDYRKHVSQLFTAFQRLSTHKKLSPPFWYLSEGL